MPDKSCKNCEYHDVDNQKCLHPKRDDSKCVHYHGRIDPSDYCTLFTFKADMRKEDEGEMKKYICVAKCPELDYDNSRHCIADNPNNPFPLYDYDCPCGNCPIWEELTDRPTEKSGEQE